MIDQASIVFPCHHYPIKVIGDHEPDFVDLVLGLLAEHARFDRNAIAINKSRTGRYQSINVNIVATGADQLKTINDVLRATGRVQTVL